MALLYGVDIFKIYNWICQIFRHNFSFTSCKAPRIISSQKEQTLLFILHEEPRLSWFP